MPKIFFLAFDPIVRRMYKIQLRMDPKKESTASAIPSIVHELSPFFFSGVSTGAFCDSVFRISFGGSPDFSALEAALAGTPSVFSAVSWSVKQSFVYYFCWSSFGKSLERLFLYGRSINF